MVSRMKVLHLIDRMRKGLQYILQATMALFQQVWKS